MTSPMRGALDQVFIDYGYDILLQRRLNPFDSDKAEYAKVLEKHTVRSSLSRKPALAHVADEQSEGITHSMSLIFYFRWDANPHRGDRIYEDAQNGLDKAFVYLIDSALPMRGARNEIVYWTVGVTEETLVRNS